MQLIQALAHLCRLDFALTLAGEQIGDRHGEQDAVDRLLLPELLQQTQETAPFGLVDIGIALLGGIAPSRVEQDRLVGEPPVAVARAADAANATLAELFGKGKLQAGIDQRRGLAGPRRADEQIPGQLIQELPASAEYSRNDLLSVYRGALAEQFAGQELLSSGAENLYYWSRDAKSSSAEVDYLFARNNAIFPVEVKGGASGKLRSMHLLIQQYPYIQQGYVLSSAPYGEIPQQKLTSLPLYYAYGMMKGELFR